MKKKANQLVAGDVVASGEIVISNNKSFSIRKHAIQLVRLKNPKTNNIRTAEWGCNSTIFIKGN